jgi:hypothetical protein
VLLTRFVASGYGFVCGGALVSSSCKPPQSPKTTWKGSVFKARRGQPRSKIGGLD